MQCRINSKHYPRAVKGIFKITPCEHVLFQEAFSSCLGLWYGWVRRARLYKMGRMEELGARYWETKMEGSGKFHMFFWLVYFVRSLEEDYPKLVLHPVLSFFGGLFFFVTCVTLLPE